MANGFPDQNFRIINADTGHCLVSLHGGVTHGSQDAADRLTGEKGQIAYAHTNDRVLGVQKPAAEEHEIWYLSGRADPWGVPLNYLYNKVSDIRSNWVLQPGRRVAAKGDQLSGMGMGMGAGLVHPLLSQSGVSDRPANHPYRDITEPVNELMMFGSGRDGVCKWRSADGMIFPQDSPDRVVTLALRAADGRPEAVLATRGAAPNQTWNFPSAVTR
ncbi:hypothetical protein Cme02nite_51350 [Catellatospora methionotrophica]|uniref:Uncharacterized protein n=1 Tax=Catellatospora methionotrophica TaxID=121620 RepID=A0A8J3PHV7_9ACTN|nr:hypothetical protein [Catellatospora methionotrophica]GIG16803.1 hypothetical protein Cme02nite_51350 [Catellatospora methionotrophica]